MALTQLQNVVTPEIYNAYSFLDTKTKTNIFGSGILAPNAVLSSFLSGGGLTTNLPFWNDLDSTEPDLATDDPSDVATPGNVTAPKMIAIRNIRTRGWSTADLVNELAGDDPAKRIMSRINNYWSRAYQRHLVSILTGVYADNVANDSGDMVYNISADVAGDPTAANLISAEAILEAKQTMGDAADDLAVLIMHSRVKTRLQKANLIDFIPDSEGRVMIPTYLGYQVVEDDGVRVVQGSTNTARYAYTTYLVGRGAIGFAEVLVATPFEIDRQPAQGQGMGVHQMWTRRQYAFHPLGFSFTSSSVAGTEGFPTNAECAAAANWNRVCAERKQAPLAYLITNG